MEAKIREANRSHLSFTKGKYRPFAPLLLAFFIVFLLGFRCVAQVAGDYRSNAATMNWSTAAHWQVYDGSAWQPATDYPGMYSCATCKVTIRDGHSVMLDVSPANNIGTLVIGGGASGMLNLAAFRLIVSGTLSVNRGATLELAAGTFSVSGVSTISGTVSDRNNAGTAYFGGLITKLAGAWSSVPVSNPSKIVFAGGFKHLAGTFNAGAATIGDNQWLDAAAVMTFNHPLAFTGSGNLNISGAQGVRLAGSANYMVPGNLNLTGALVVSTNGNFTVMGNTSITGAGDFRDKNNNGATVFHGTVVHNSTGQWVSTTVLTPANMIFWQGFENLAGAFSAGGATIGDNKVLKADVLMGFAGGMTVMGDGDITITGRQGRGVAFAGTGANYSMRNLTLSTSLLVSTTGNCFINGTANLTAGAAFSDVNAGGVTAIQGNVTIAASATFTATSLTRMGSMVCNGSILQDNATGFAFNVGSLQTAGRLEWSGAGSMRIGGALNILAGEVVNKLGGLLQIFGTMSGTVLRQTANSRLGLGGATPVLLDTLDASAQGNLVSYNGASAVIKGQTYWHLQMAGTGIKTMPAAPITILGNFTLTSALTTCLPNNGSMYLQGDFINNAGFSAFRAGNGMVTLNGSAPQTIAGTSPTTFKDLVINNQAGVQLGRNIIVGGVLRLWNGIIHGNGNTTSISSTGSVSRIAGYINGIETRFVPRGALVNSVFDIGDSLHYTPVRLSFTRVSTAGNITVSTTPKDHPQLAASTLDDGKSINRYWTIKNAAAVFTNYAAELNYIETDKDAGVTATELLAGIYQAGWSYPAVPTGNGLSARLTGLTNFGEFALANLLLCRVPSIVVNQPAPICKGTTLSLRDTVLVAGSTAGLSYSYWMDSAATVAVADPTAVSAGTYYIKGTTAIGGCHATVPVEVRLSATVGASISGSANICAGSSATVTLALQGNGPWSGSLSDGTLFSGALSPLTISVAPAVNTTFTVNSLIDSACSAVADDLVGTANIVVVQRPTPANAGPDQDVCSNSVSLAANPVYSGTGNWIIVAGNGGIVQSPGTPSSTFNGVLGNTYTLRWITSNAPCPSSSDLVVIKLIGSNWTGAVNNDWNLGANWCSGVVPSGTFDLSLQSGLPNYPVISTEVSVRNLVVNTGASISTSANGKLTIVGSYSNAGVINNNGSIVLSGSTMQSFPGPTATVQAMRNVEVNNVSGVKIDQSFALTGTLTPKSGIIRLMDKQITLVSNAAGTARIGVVAGGFDYTGGGRFELQRYFPARRCWHLVTAPLTNSCSIYDGWQNSKTYTAGRGTFITGTGGLNGLDAGNSSLKIWDPSSQQLVNATSTVVKLSPGTNGSADNQGYFIFMRGDRNPANLNVSNSNATTLVSYGRLQTGTQIFEGSAIAGNQTLIGNPYASPIDFNAVARKNVLKRFTVWDPNLGSLGAYVTLDDLDNDGVFTSSVPSSSQTQYIQSHQAFIVETATNGLASITINETSKVGSASSASRPSAKLARLQLNLLQVKENDIVQLADGALAEFDDGFGNEVNAEDALKFANLGETIALARDGKLLAIERKQLSNEADTLFIETRKLSVGSYHLQMSPSNPGETKLIAMLEDLYSGTATALSLNEPTTVPFTVTGEAASAGPHRFRIVLKPVKELPGKINAIDADLVGEDVKLSWAVTNSVGIASFDVSHSTDGVNFEQTRRIYLTANNALPANYEHLDLKVIPGVHYYQVKLHLKNGEEQSSAVARVTVNATKSSIKVYPNPVQDRRIQLTAYNQPGGLYRVKLISSNGQVVLTSTLSIAGRVWNTSFTLPDHVAPGVYHLELSGERGSVLRETLIVK